MAMVYLPGAETLEEVGLQTIVYYVQVQRQTIFDFIINQPNFGFCKGGRGEGAPAPTNGSGSSQWT